MAINFFNSLAVDTDVLYVDAANDRVGIGTASPSTPLEIVSSDNTLLYLNSSTANVYLRLDDSNSTNGNFIGATTDDMHFWTNNTERLRIGSAGQIGIGGANYGVSGQVLTSNGSGSAPSWQSTNWSEAQRISNPSIIDIYNNNNGNVGIGTSTPDYDLDVAGEIGIDSYIRHNGDSNTFMGFSANDTIKFRTAGSDRLIVFPGGGVDVYNDFTINNGSPEMYFQTGATHYRWMVAAQENVDAALEITPSTTTGGSTYSTPVAVFKATGNVGIGTTSPARVLHIVDSSVAAIQLENSSEADSFIDFKNPSRTFRVGYDDSTDLFKVAVTNFNDNSLVVNSSGNVGVGTASPGYKLDVSGNIRAEGPDGGLVLRTWTGNTSYGMLGTANMSGSEYSLLTDGTNTYISGGASGSVYLRAGNNYSNNQLELNSSKARFYGDVQSDDQFINNGNGFKSLNFRGMVGDYDTNGTAAKIIWTIGDSWNSLGAMYGLAYEYNGTYGHHLALRENGTTYQRISFYNGSFFSGTVTSNTDFRAPIFYDTDNTAYYIDPASTGIAAYLRGDIEIINEQPLLELNDYTATNTTNLNAWVSFQYNGTEGGYVGFGSASNSNLYLYNFNGDVLINGSKAETNNSFRAPIFYDSNDTGYYVDPSNTNVSVRVAGFVDAGPDAAFRCYDGSNFRGGIGDGQWASGNSSYTNDLAIYASNSFNLHAGSNTPLLRASSSNQSINHIGNITSDAMQRPVARWGVGSASTGMVAIALPGDTGDYDMTTIEIEVYEYNSNAGSKIRVSGHPYNSGTGWYNYSVSIDGVFNKSIYLGKSSSKFYILLGDTSSSWTYGSVIVRANTEAEYYNNITPWGNAWSITQVTTDPTSVKTSNLNTTSSRTSYTYGYSESGGSFRAPIFYDSNDTAYYLDPNTTATSLNTAGGARIRNIDISPSSLTDTIQNKTSGGNLWLQYGHNGPVGLGYGGGLTTAYNGFTVNSGLSRLNGGVRLPDINGTINSMWGVYGWDSQLQFSKRNISTDAWEGTAMFIDYGSLYVQSDYSFRAPAFYDSNNTAYYTDPASTSVFNRIVAGTTSTSNSGTALHVTAASSGTSTPIAYFYPTFGNYGGIGVQFQGLAYGNATYFNSVSPYDGTVCSFRKNGTQVGSIAISTSSTSFNTTSDYRLKENITELTDGIERVKQLQPKRFNFIGDEDTVDGFIAHEAVEVVPESVTGEKDEVLPNGEPVYQGIDQAKLVPLLTAALQEAITKIEDLETRIQILENQ